MKTVAPETSRRRSHPGQPGAESGAGKKVVTCPARREATRWVQAELGLTERRACRLIGITLRALRYRAREDGIEGLRDGCSPWRARGLGTGLGACMSCSDGKGTKSTTNGSIGSIAEKGWCGGACANGSQLVSACPCLCRRVPTNSGRSIFMSDQLADGRVFHTLEHRRRLHQGVPSDPGRHLAVRRSRRPRARRACAEHGRQRRW